MNKSHPLTVLFRLGTFVLLPLMVALSAVWWFKGASGEGTLVRFANALLTSFTLMSFVLLFTLFVYGDARKRPIAPLFGMCLSGLTGAGLTVYFLSQGELLMEDNGSVRAQALSNIIRFGTTMIGLGLAGMVVAGALFSSVMSGPRNTILFEEE